MEDQQGRERWGESLNQQLSSWLRRGLEHLFLYSAQGPPVQEKQASPSSKSSFTGLRHNLGTRRAGSREALICLLALVTARVLTQSLSSSLNAPHNCPNSLSRFCLISFCLLATRTHPAGLIGSTSFHLGYNLWKVLLWGPVKHVRGLLCACGSNAP